MKKFFSIALIAAIVATSAVMLSACKGGDKNATTATAATTATTAATTATTAPTAAATQAAQSGSNTGSDANTANQNSDSSVTYGGITQDKAYSLAVESAGQGAQVISAYQGSIPSGPQAGSEVWVVTVQLPDGTHRSYYCGYPFCFSIEDAFGQFRGEIEQIPPMYSAVDTPLSLTPIRSSNTSIQLFAV